MYLLEATVGCAVGCTWATVIGATDVLAAAVDAALVLAGAFAPLVAADAALCVAADEPLDWVVELLLQAATMALAAVIAARERKRRRATGTTSTGTSTANHPHGTKRGMSAARDAAEWTQ